MTPTIRPLSPLADPADSSLPWPPVQASTARTSSSPIKFRACLVQVARASRSAAHFMVCLLLLALAAPGCSGGDDDTGASPTPTDTATPAATTTPDASSPATTATPDPTPTPATDADEDGSPASVDCDDQNPATHPGAPEVCDGLDNNCSGRIDEGLLYTDYHPDDDQDGFGASSSSLNACAPPDGFLVDGSDCDDLDETVHPGAPELCDDQDNDCDDKIDEGLLVSTWYPDVDLDGYGDSATSQAGCGPVPSGYAVVGGDCDDTDASIYPAAPELCDKKDNDCDGQIDESSTVTTWYSDLDHDGYGDPNASLTGCAQPPGMVSDHSDCDDADAAVNPGHAEAVCNGIDDNCSGPDDDHPDLDLDGYDTCLSGATGADEYAPDCNDQSASSYPGALETYFDGQDSNCNGYADFIIRYAGTSPGYSGDSGQAIVAQLKSPSDMVMDSSGSLYIADSSNHRVRKVAANGIITTFAGTGTAGFSGDGGPATTAMLNTPKGVALGPAGELYISDTSNYVVRRVDSQGMISTVAGSNAVGFYGDGGPATAARIATSERVVVDAVGNLYIADSSSARVRMVDLEGTIRTVVGTGTAGGAGDGSPASLAQISYPRGLCLDAVGNLYIADSSNDRVRKVDTAGIISTVAGTGTPGYSGDNGTATLAQLDQPSGVAVDTLGNLFIADRGNQVVRRVYQGKISTIVGTYAKSGNTGDNGVASAALLSAPNATAIDRNGNLFIADMGNARIRQVLW